MDRWLIVMVVFLVAITLGDTIHSLHKRDELDRKHVSCLEAGGFPVLLFTTKREICAKRPIEEIEVQ